MLTLVACAKKKSKDNDSSSNSTNAIYLFGVSQQLSDSIAYVTNIYKIDRIELEKKTKFLPYRSEFSLQLKEYLEGQLHLKQQTACVFYSAKRKKLSKKFYKIKKRYLDNPNTKIVMIDEERFVFKHPLDAATVQEEATPSK